SGPERAVSEPLVVRGRVPSPLVLFVTGPTIPTLARPISRRLQWTAMIAFGRGRGALGFLIVGVALGGLDAHAAPASAWIHPEDGEDDHGRPHAYLDPTLAVPPASAEEPDYPLAAAFIPADP